jgi:RNA polymerase sigma-70 factor, ECF subfamily
MPDLPEPDDFSLIDLTLQGEVRSFSALIRKYQDRIYTFVAKSISHTEDAKDLTQNIFFNAFSNLAKFRGESSFLTWLYRIAINQVKNYWRDNKKRSLVAEADLGNFFDEYGTRFTEATDGKTGGDPQSSRLMVNELLAFLPLEQRQIFVFYYVIGYTCQEIAEILKTSPSNVKIQLFRGRKILYDKYMKFFK